MHAPAAGPSEHPLWGLLHRLAAVVRLGPASRRPPHCLPEAAVCLLSSDKYRPRAQACLVLQLCQTPTDNSKQQHGTGGTACIAMNNILEHVISKDWYYVMSTWSLSRRALHVLSDARKEKLLLQST